VTTSNLSPAHRYAWEIFLACEQSVDPDELAARRLAARLLWFAEEVRGAFLRPGEKDCPWPNERWLQQERDFVRELRRTQFRARSDAWIALMELSEIIGRVSIPVGPEFVGAAPVDRVLGEFRRQWPEYAPKLDKNHVNDALLAAYKPRKGKTIRKWDAFAMLARPVLDEPDADPEDIRRELDRLRRQGRKARPIRA
jgi:hypothetical protein